MARRFEYELLGARSWNELRDLLYHADEKGGWQAIGYSVVDGVHHALMKRPAPESAIDNGGVAGSADEAVPSN